MKYIFLLLIIVWFATGISLSGCKKEPEYIHPQPTDTFYVDPEFKRYWYFPEGSWWIYKRIDTTADVYDTVTIYNSSREIYYNQQQANFAYEFIMQNLAHSSKYFDFANKGKVLQNIGNDLFGVNRISSAGPGGFFSYSIFFNWPIEGQYNNHIIDTNFITLPIGKIEKVIHFEDNFSGSCWMAKDIGFIKYIHNNSDHKKGTSTWELVNYHINK